MNRASARGRRPVSPDTPPAGSPRERRIPRGSRRGLLVVIALTLVPASAATAGVLEERLQATRDEGREVKQELSVVDRRQQVVVRQVSALNARIAELDRPIGRLSLQIDQLEYRIERRQQRIEELKRDYVRQKRAILQLDRELTAARELLSSRVVAAYMTGDSGMLEQLAGAGSIRDLFAREEALGQVVGLDQQVIDRISDTERAVRLKRARNQEVQREIRGDISGLAADRAELDGKRDVLQSKRAEIDEVRAERDSMLQALREREQALGQRLDDLQEDAAVLQQAIETGQVTFGGQVGGVSPSGLMWPVSGPVVSGFGPRWGRMHEGIDIAIGAGNPIHAAAAGVVTHAGWMGGYGNLVIVQHAGNLSTSYAHQSQIASAVGQLVTQGQVIGFIGCTGHCYGDHLHFETRVGGAAVDPMQYL